MRRPFTNIERPVRFWLCAVGLYINNGISVPVAESTPLTVRVFPNASLVRPLLRVFSMLGLRFAPTAA